MAAEALRERTRRAVRAELSVAAQELFLRQGYEATTVDEIAEAAGISRRSFFRYFATKEDVVVDKYVLLGDELVEALAARPADEPVWRSLRRAFDVVVEYYGDEHRRERAAVMSGIVTASPALHARYLQQWDLVQARLADAVLARRGVGDPAGTAAVHARALVGAAMACLSAAQRAAVASDPLTFGPRLDEVMAAMEPIEPFVAAARHPRPKRSR